jgi:DNA-binding transcriptional ArsR family regulator
MIPIEEINLLHSHICQAIGDPRRIQILYALSEQPLNVTDLARALNIPQPTVSRHLAVLRQRSFVIAEHSGASVIYTLAEPRVISVLDSMRQLLRGILERQSDTLNKSEE